MVPAPLRIMRARCVGTGSWSMAAAGRDKALLAVIGLHGAARRSISLGDAAIEAKENRCTHLACSSFPVPDCPSAYAGWGNFMPWQH